VIPSRIRKKLPHESLKKLRLLLTIYTEDSLVPGGVHVMSSYDRAAKNQTGLKHSDVCLSCRGIRPDHPPEDAVAAFKPTRIEWSYINSADFVNGVKKTGVKFVGALNTIRGDRSGRDSVDYDGNRLVAPWMTGFNDRGGPGWACVNSPDAAAFREQWLKDFLEVGADAIQHDDWAFNLAAFGWGGCFCSHCMGQFENYLKKNLSPQEKQKYGISPARTFNYREYLRTHFGVANTSDYQRRRDSLPLQKEFAQFNRISTRKYFLHLAEASRQYRGGAVPLTVNANMLPESFAEKIILDLDLVDYLVGETPATHEGYLDLVWMLKLSDALRLPQVVSPFPAERVRVNEVRGVLAAVYALGHWPLVPWDVWQGPDKKERWYGSVEQYGDIYRLAASRGLLDGFEAWSDVALFVPAVSDTGLAARYADRGKKLIAQLLAAGTPFRAITAGKVGGDLVEIPLEPDDFKDVRAIFLCGSLNALDDNTRKEFKKLADGVSVIDASGAKGHSQPAGAVKKADLPAVCKANDPMVHVFPRRRISGEHTSLALHLLNRDYDKGADEYHEKKEVAVELTARVLGGASDFSSAVYHQPGREPIYLQVEKKRGKVRLAVPSVELWGVIEVM